MTTPFLAITTAVRDALVADPAVVPADSVRRGRPVIAQLSEGSAIFLAAERATGKQLDVAGTMTEWDTIVSVHIMARATSGQDAEAAVDPLLAAAWARLYAMTPPAGALSCVLEPQIAWDADADGQPVGSATFMLRVTHHTTGGALAAP